MADNFIDEMQEWRILVGTTILSFGEIELITLKCLAHIPKDEIYKSVSTLPFGRRIDLVVEILNSRESKKNKEIINFIEKLKKAKKLSEYRNVLAHNPLMADIYMDNISGDIKVEQIISSSKNKDKSIDLASLKEIAAEVESLASDLYMAIGKIIEAEQ